MMKAKLKRVSRMVILLVILIFGVVFTLLNPGLIDVNLVAKVVSIPLAVLMLVCFALGLIMGLLIGYARGRWRRYRTTKEENVHV